MTSELEHLSCKAIKGKFIKKLQYQLGNNKNKYISITFKEGLLIKSYSFYVILMIIYKIIVFFLFLR